MKQNFVVEFIFIVVLILFSVYRYFYNVESVVMKVFSPTMAAVDLNGNRQIESGEIVCVSGIKTFNNNLADEELAKTLDVSYKDSLSLAYITGDFSNSLLMNKSVKFKPDAEQHNPDCTGGDILINNKSYRETLLNEGYAYSDEFEYNSAKLKERIESVKELQPVIMNRKSKKYHEIGCKFGKASEDYAVLLKNDLPENAVPCKWCHKPQENPQAQAGAKVYPDRISDGSVRMFLTDMTTHLNVKNDCSSNICRALLGEINNAKETIDIAAYGWVSVPEVDEALKNAVARGVKFRMVYDFSAREAYYPDTTKIARFAVEAKNDLIPGNSRMSEYLMHNKFMIFDGKKVAAGSLNYSKTDFSEFNSNFILFVDSPEVARVYTEEFEQMLSGKFHTDKTKRAQYSNYKIGDTDLQVYFSPQDNTITEKVIGYIDGAKKYIYLPVFVITHKSLEAALLRAKERGVDVRLIVDATNVSAKKSSVQNLRSLGIPVKVENYAGKLHSKSIIIDDEYILAGSMNFSRSGESRNDENMMIIKNPRLAVFYKDFFLYLWGKIPDIYLTRNPRAESIDSIGSCFDGIDNDFDGKIDKSDEGCFIRSK